VALQFAYDEPLASPLIARICEQKAWPLSFLAKALRDTNQLADAEAILRQIETS
jgi:hypothetical protein